MLLRIILGFHILLIFIPRNTKGDVGKCRDGVSKDLTPHQLLKQDVFCSYDKGVRPVMEHTSNTTVTIKMFIKFFFLDESKDLLEVHSWLGLGWKDNHLKWNPNDYSNISFIHVDNRDIWQPDISLYNSGNMDSRMSWARTICVVYSTGSILCVPTMKWSAQCSINLKQWPFDSHQCIMRIGSWAHTGEQLNMVLQDGGVGLEDYQSNRDWDLQEVNATKNVNVYDCCPNATYQTVVYKFVIKRHSYASAATVIIPTLILAMTTLSSFWLDPKTPNRLTVCCVSTLCHCLFLQYLGTKLPSNGVDVPVIILLYRDSLVITGIALLLSVIVQRLCTPEIYSGSAPGTSPEWLNRIVGVILDQRAGQIIFLGQFDSKPSSTRGDGASLMDEGSQSPDRKVNQEWSMFVNILDRSSFIIFLLTYVILFVSLIPKG